MRVATVQVQPQLTRTTLWTMAATGGVTVANLYYNQPLLADIARQYGLSADAAGLIPMLTQIGYAAGMLLIVPLGDMVERRRLVMSMMALSIVALIAMGLAPGFYGVLAASFAVGITSVVPHLMVPFAALLAPVEYRGRAVATVLSGMIIGILLARTAAGSIGARVGWRGVFFVACVAIAVLAVVARCQLPASPPRERTRWTALMASLWHLFTGSAELREAAFTGAMLFGGFSVFWATLVFRLQTPPFHYGAEAAGLFGLVGVVGAMAAPLAGRLSDKRHPRPNVVVSLVLVALSFVAMWIWASTLWGLIVGVILLDAGVQAGHVSNQSRIYAIAPERPSRVNTVYMVIYFAGGALGSIAGAAAWQHGGWNGVCGVGLAMVIAGLLWMWVHGRRVAEVAA
jgi:predicted MFS family arabinose efflux permease